MLRTSQLYTLIKTCYKATCKLLKYFSKNSLNRQLPSEKFIAKSESETDLLLNNDINLFYYPDAPNLNTYQNLLYADFSKNGISTICLCLEDLLKRIGEDKDAGSRVVFHLYLTDPILSSAKSCEEAILLKDKYLKCLDAYLKNDGKFIVTIHSILPHECNYYDIEIEMRHSIAKRAHSIHVASKDMANQIKDIYSLPQDKIEISPLEKLDIFYSSTHNSSKEYVWNKANNHFTLVVDTLFKNSYDTDKDYITDITTEQQLVKCQMRPGNNPNRDSARVAIVILNYEYFSDTVKTIRSIDRSVFTDYHIYIVDNSSAKRSFQSFANLFPNYTVIKTDRNIGYAGGNNVALKLIKDKNNEYIWILNPDILVPSQTMGELVAIAESNPNLGIIGSKIYYGLTKEKIWFAGGSIEWDDGLVTKHLRMGEPDDPNLREPFSVDYVTGASIFMRKQVLDDVGLFPEDYFLYFEDTDWCMKAKRKSILMQMYPTTYLFHRERSKTSGLPKPYVLYYFIRNRLIMCKKYRPSKLEKTKENLLLFVDSMIKGIEKTDSSYVVIARKLTDQAIEDGLNDVKGWRDLQLLMN